MVDTSEQLQGLQQQLAELTSHNQHLKHREEALLAMLQALQPGVAAYRKATLTCNMVVPAALAKLHRAQHQLVAINAGSTQLQQQLAAALERADSAGAKVHELQLLLSSAHSELGAKNSNLDQLTQQLAAERGAREQAHVQHHTEQQLLCDAMSAAQQRAKELEETIVAKEAAIQGVVQQLQQQLQEGESAADKAINVRDARIRMQDIAIQQLQLQVEADAGAQARNLQQLSTLEQQVSALLEQGKQQQDQAAADSAALASHAEAMTQLASTHAATIQHLQEQARFRQIEVQDEREKTRASKAQAAGAERYAQQVERQLAEQNAQISQLKQQAAHDPAMARKYAQLQSECNQLQLERTQLQSECTLLTAERDTAHTRIQILQANTDLQHKDHLRCITYLQHAAQSVLEDIPEEDLEKVLRATANDGMTYMAKAALHTSQEGARALLLKAKLHSQPRLRHLVKSILRQQAEDEEECARPLTGKYYSVMRDPLTEDMQVEHLDLVPAVVHPAAEAPHHHHAPPTHMPPQGEPPYGARTFGVQPEMHGPHHSGYAYAYVHTSQGSTPAQQPCGASFQHVPPPGFGAFGGVNNDQGQYGPCHTQSQQPAEEHFSMFSRPPR